MRVSALAQVAAATGREAAETGGGVLAVEYVSPLRDGYVAEVTERDGHRVDVVAGHLTAKGEPCGCDDGAAIWTLE